MPLKNVIIKDFVVVLAIVLVGVVVSVLKNDWQWFSRCGSVLVSFGVFLTSREIIEHTKRLKLRRKNLPIEGGMGSLRQYCNRDWANERDFRSIARSQMLEEIDWQHEGIGFYILIFGTLVWGFGDLLGLWLGH